MTYSIVEALDQRIKAWDSMGAPCLLERFVRRNGKPFKAQLYAGRRMKAKECFSNAAIRMDIRGIRDDRYVEGYGWRPGLPLLIHHAWIGIDGCAIDPTWEKPEECQYFGVEFDVETVQREITRTGYYGLLDLPTGLNIEFMLAQDAGLIEFIPERFRAQFTKEQA